MSLYEYYSQAIQTVREEIRQKEETYILGVSTDELVEYYLAKFSLPLIEKSPDRDPIIEKGKSQSSGWTSYLSFTIKYPIIYKERIELA